jgi:hypothetical protein
VEAIASLARLFFVIAIIIHPPIPDVRSSFLTANQLVLSEKKDDPSSDDKHVRVSMTSSVIRSQPCQFLEFQSRDLKIIHHQMNDIVGTDA